MASITTRKLSRNTASVIDELQASGEPVMVVRNGEPVAVLSAVDPAHVEEAVLATAPEYNAALARADEAAGAGETETFEEIFGEEPKAEAGERELVGVKLAPEELNQLVGTVVERVPIAALQLPEGRRQELEAISRRLARRLLVSNIEQTTRLVGLSLSMIGAEGATDEESEALEARMVEMLGRSDPAVAEEG